MIARLRDISIPIAELKLAGCDCLKVTDSGGKATFLQREGIEPEQVADLLTSLHGQLQGDYLVELWAKGQRTERLRYAITGTGGGGGVLNGLMPQVSGIGIGEYLAVLKEANKAQLDLERERMKQTEGQTDYFKEGIGILRQLVAIHGAKSANPAMSGHPASNIKPVPSSAETEEPEEGEQDAADRFYQVEPEADQVLAAILKLKEQDPAMYDQTKGMLTNLVGNGQHQH